MKVTLKTVTPNAEINLVEIARVSSNREDKTEEPHKLVQYLIKHNHWSPFEHSFLTLEITTSVAIGRQFLRHRSFYFQEFSMRYAEVERFEDVEFRLKADKNRQSSSDVIGGVNHKDGGAFETWFDEAFIQKLQEEPLEPEYAPIDFEVGEGGDGQEMKPREASPESQARILDINREAWLHDVRMHLARTLELYQQGLAMDFAKETARFILPLCAQTTLYVTGPLRSWIHLIDERTKPGAQKEARLVAQAAKAIIIKELPILSAALNWTI